MFGKISERLFLLLVTITMAVALVSGCEPESARKPVEISGAVSDAPNAEERQPAVESVVQTSSETGQYSVQLFDGKISLKSAWASRITILEDLAGKIGFGLRYTDASDKFVQVDQRMIGIPELLEVLLDGVDYAAAYNSQAGSRGFTISSLKIGLSMVESEAIEGNINAHSSIDLELLVPDSTGEIQLGPDPEEEDLATRLQFGSVEEKIDAIGELDLDSRGLNAAYQVYMQANSPLVRIAVLDLVESEDNHLARLMSLLSRFRSSIRWTTFHLHLR